MKCVRCGHDSKYKDRSDGRCPGCRAQFAFEPQKKDPVTDAAFKSAIDAVSANGRTVAAGTNDGALCVWTLPDPLSPM